MKLAVKAPLALALLTVVLGVAFGVWLHLAMERVTDEAARDQAVSQLRVAARAYESGTDLPSFARFDDEELPAELRTATESGHVVSLVSSDPPLAWAAQRTANGKTVSVRTSWDAGSALMDSLDADLSWGVAVLTGAAAIAALWVASTLSRRLRAAERAAMTIADGDLDVRVGEKVRGRDEVAELGRTIDVLAERMQERLASEKRVTADIAHDLRTPLTGLVTAADLLPPGRPTELVRRQVAALRRLVEELLEVARLDAADQTLDPAEVRTETLARRAVAASSVGEIEMVVTADATLVTDPRRVERVLVNLIENASRHGAPPLQCRVDGRVISVVDHGPGFPAALLEHGPQRFRTHAPERGGGHGLGLTIAAGQTRALGAELTFSNEHDADAGRRAVASLTLPAAADASAAGWATRDRSGAPRPAG